MVDTVSQEWIFAPRIYVENARNHDAAPAITMPHMR